MRRVVLTSRLSQSFAGLCSFAQWARAMGREATGHVVSAACRPAMPEPLLLVPADSLLAPAPVGVPIVGLVVGGAAKSLHL